MSAMSTPHQPGSREEQIGGLRRPCHPARDLGPLTVSDGIRCLFLTLDPHGSWLHIIYSSVALPVVSNGILKSQTYRGISSLKSRLERWPQANSKQSDFNIVLLPDLQRDRRCIAVYPILCSPGELSGEFASGTRGLELGALQTTDKAGFPNAPPKRGGQTPPRPTFADQETPRPRLPVQHAVHGRAAPFRNH
ncbi:hypothetical protein VTK26DRAFT_5690 [Humicola hyalothermophila]